MLFAPCDPLRVEDTPEARHPLNEPFTEQSEIEVPESWKPEGAEMALSTTQLVLRCAVPSSWALGDRVKPRVWIDRGKTEEVFSGR